MAKKRKRIKNKNRIADPMQWARDHLPKQELDILLNVVKKPLPIAMRINLLKTDIDVLKNDWAKYYGWEVKPVPLCPSGYRISSAENAPSQTIEHKLGYYYIQESASMLPGELFGFKGTQRPLILDMAAAPGGKTTHLIDRIQERGLVIANDASRSRIPALRVVLKNWGAINQAVTCMQGEWFGSAYPDTFDAVLLDAPCSMQGLRVSTSHSR